jgi:3-phenylpropionate/trans-cinnamate dioxygenase ferredoxin subunit
MAWLKVASFDEIGDGETLAVIASGREICVARLDGEVYAFANNCTHRDFPLVDGELDRSECSITCEWHGARFDMRTGAPLSPPATRAIAVYPCRVEEDSIFVDPG